MSSFRRLIILLLWTFPAFATGPTWVQSLGSFSVSTTATSHTYTLTHTPTAGNTVVAFVSTHISASQQINYVCGGTSCTSITSTGKFFPYTWIYCPNTNNCPEIWIERNAVANNSVTINWAVTTVSDVQFEEYSNVSAIGQVVQCVSTALTGTGCSATASATHPGIVITTADANNVVVMATSAPGTTGVPTSSTGNLRDASSSGATASFDAGSACDNNAASSGTAVTCQVTITSGAWAALGVELRSATSSDTSNFVSAYQSNSVGSENVAMPSIAGPFVGEAFLSGNTGICWGVWPYSGSGQTPTVTTRNTLSGSTVDTFTNDVQVNDTSNMSTGMFHVAATAATEYVNWAWGTSINSQPGFVYGCVEMNGITTSSPKRTSASASALPGGTLSTSALTTVSGDIVVVATSIDTIVQDTNNQNQGVGYCAPGPGFILLTPSTVSGTCTEYLIASGTSVTPSMYEIPATPNSAYGSGYVFNIVAVAYKPSGGQGTSATGLHIGRTMTPVISGGGGSVDGGLNTWVNCPVAGNLNSFYISNQLTGTPESNTFKIWDSNQGTYSLNDPSPNSSSTAVPFLLYSSAPSLDNSAMCQLYQSSTNGSNSEMLQRDIYGAATSNIFDTMSSTCPSTSVYHSTGCAGADQTLGGGYSQSPNIQPSASGELVLATASNGTGPEGGISSPSGAIYECPYFSNMTDLNSSCYGEGHGHFYTTGTSSLNFTWVAGTNASGGLNGSAVAIKPAPAAAGGGCSILLLGVGKC